MLVFAIREASCLIFCVSVEGILGQVLQHEAFKKLFRLERAFASKEVCEMDRPHGGCARRFLKERVSHHSSGELALH